MMSDERLAEIEQTGCDDSQLCDGERRELVAEVRSLKRALALSEASRGVPSVYEDADAARRYGGGVPGRMWQKRPEGK